MNDYAKDMLQPWWHRPLYYFRWATFIPGGLLGGGLAAFAMGMFSFPAAVAASGAAMIYAAAFIAPSDNKRTPVVIMATLCTCFWLLNTPEDWLCLVGLVGSIVAAVHSLLRNKAPTTSDSSSEPSTNVLRTDTAL